jgi:hypothetical protein
MNANPDQITNEDEQEQDALVEIELRLWFNSFPKCESRKVAPSE